MRYLSLTTLLAACAPGLDQPIALAPADGQSAVPAHLALSIRGDVGFPPHEPLPTVLRVVDATRGGQVSGSTWVDADGLHFLPDVPWRPATTYVWQVESPADEARLPSPTIPEALVGAQTFTTDPRLDVLAITRFDERLCVVTSRPPLPDEAPRLQIMRPDDPGGTLHQATSVELLDASDFDPFAPGGTDPGLGGVCLGFDTPLDGDRLRVQLLARSWLLPVSSAPPRALSARLRREVYR